MDKAPAKGQVTSTGIPVKRVIIIFVGLLLGILMSALDQTIVSTALPHIGADLHGFQEITWIITTYLLAQTIVMPVYGKLGDFIGRKLSFQIAIVIFLVGSILAGIAPSMNFLIAMRAVQGVGAGGLMIGAQTIIAEIVSARERGKYMSVMGPMIGVATVLGPLLGGFLTTAVSWRWIFYINVPIGIAAMIVTAVVLKLPRARRKPRVDYWGTVTIGGAAATLVLLLTWGGRQYAWDSGVIIGLIIATAVLAAGFVLAERRAVEPIIPLRLFRDNPFRTNSILAFLIGLALFGAVSYLPTYLQISLGATATMSGVLMLPLMGGLMLAAVATGQLMTRIGRYKIFPILGAGVGTVGMYLLSLMNADTPRGISSLYMIVLGLGIGFIMPTLVLVVQNSVSKEDMGSATAGVNFFRQIGGSFGTAIIGSLFLSRLTTNLHQNLPHSFVAKLGGHAQGITTSILEKFPKPIQHGYVVSFANALTPLYAYVAPVILLGFVIAWFLKEKPLSTVLARGAAAQKAPDAPARHGHDEHGQHQQRWDEPVVTAPESPAGVAPAAVAPAVPGEETGQRPELSEQLVRALNTLHSRSAGTQRADGEPLPARLFEPVEPGQNGTGNGDGNGNGGHVAAGNGHTNGTHLSVTGSVYGAEGAAASASVTLLDLGGRQLEGASTHVDGTYRMGLPGPGTYLLAVLPERDGGQAPVAELITSAGDTVVRDIRLGRS
jgi:EmrB/QacA subfamily drug resistance transporter